MVCVRRTSKKYLSRPSPPYSAQECCGKKMVGNNGKTWISIKDARGICHWRQQEFDTNAEFEPLVTKLAKKIYVVFWNKIARGEHFLIYTDGTYEIKKLPQKKADDIYDDPEVKYNIWTAASRDALLFFVFYLLTKLSKKEINDILSKKDSIIEMIVSRPNFFLQKYKLFGNKDYTLKSIDDRKVNKKKIVEKMKR